MPKTPEDTLNYKFGRPIEEIFVICVAKGRYYDQGELMTNKERMVLSALLWQWAEQNLPAEISSQVCSELKRRWPKLNATPIGLN